MKVSSAFISNSIPFASSPVQFLKHLFSQSWPQARNKCTCVWCTKVRSEAGITTSHISLSEVSLEFWISSKMAVRLGVRPGYCAFPVHPRKWKILFKTILVCSKVEGLWHTFSKTDKLQNSCGSYPGHMFFFGKGGTCRNLKKWWYIYINR